MTKLTDEQVSRLNILDGAKKFATSLISFVDKVGEDGNIEFPLDAEEVKIIIRKTYHEFINQHSRND